MVYQKRYAESIVFNGEMLVMGGYNQNIGWLNAVEKRSSDGSWTEMEPWTLPRMIFDFCAVQMDENRIMVLGKAYNFCVFLSTSQKHIWDWDLNLSRKELGINSLCVHIL